MNITTSITVQDFVYDFYRQAASDLGNVTPEDLMAQALFRYAGIVAADMLKREGSASN